jgi:hypothetical protein
LMIFLKVIIYTKLITVTILSYENFSCILVSDNWRPTLPLWFISPGQTGAQSSTMWQFSPSLLGLSPTASSPRRAVHVSDHGTPWTPSNFSHMDATSPKTPKSDYRALLESVLSPGPSAPIANSSMVPTSK